MNICKLGFIKMCDNDNVLNDWKSIVELSLLLSWNLLGFYGTTFYYLGIKLEI